MQGSKTYLIEVIPLTKSHGHPLSYFSTLKLSPGIFVEISLKKGRALGVVNNVRSAASAKTDIRQASFSLKKISQKQIYQAGISSHFLTALKRSALFYATPIGLLINSILPKEVQNDPEKYFSGGEKIHGLPRNKIREIINNKEALLLQMETEERYGQYRGLVRQAFARRNSVMFIVPTLEDMKRALVQLSPGIESFVYDRSKWQEALKDEHPVLFITTPSGIAFDRPDLDVIIFERENSRAYRTLARPYIHFKNLVENLARETGRQLVLGDSVFSVETLWREKRGDYGELSLIRWRLPAAPAQLVDVRAKADGNGKFEIFSKELRSLIERALKEKEGIFLFGARRGLAPTTICGDCGTLLPCLNCGAPVVLHTRSDIKNARGQTFICHACGTNRDSDTTCGYCGSWKLMPLGIGIERIASEARQLFHGKPVEILDKDHASTATKARGIVKKFNEKGGILVGTELAFFHLEKVTYSAVVSVDSLFSVPDFGINERIFYLVSRLREMTIKESIVQTRNIGKQILAWSVQGNIIDFYLNEINERKELLYPPFSIFIKIENKDARNPPSREDTDGRSKIQETKHRFARWNPEIYKDSIIIRVPRERWTDAELAQELSLLGPQFSIKVDPESIL